VRGCLFSISTLAACWHLNRDPRWPLAYYLDAIDEQARLNPDGEVFIPRKMRSDHGTETVEIYGVHLAFHEHSEFGNIAECYGYGRSVHNQKIECYWSGFIKQWVCRWQEIFGELAFEDLWQDNPIDRLALVYIFMPILRAELAVHQRDYNSYRMRRNTQSNLPSGQPADNYFLRDDDDPVWAVKINAGWTDSIRHSRLAGFDPDESIDGATLIHLDGLMEGSPHGEVVNIVNARDQYLYIRQCLNALNFNQM